MKRLLYGLSMWSIRPITDLAGLEHLRAEAAREGFGAIERLFADFASGANRFDGPGEVLLAADIEGDAVAVAGLNVDPYEPSASRIRRLYVMAAHRRTGVGTALLAALTVTARAGCRIRVRVPGASAAAFYEANGFVRVDSATATHEIWIE